MTKIFEGIVIYGAAWCPDARRARRFLDEHKANYRWIDIDEDNQALGVC
jgi:glutaredoxin